MHKICLTLAVLALPFSVAAQDDEAEEAREFEQSARFVYARSGPAETRTYSDDENLFEGRMSWYFAGELAESRTVTFGQYQYGFGEGQVLPQIRIWPDGADSEPELIYCSPRRSADPVTAAMMGRIMAGPYGYSAGSSPVSNRSTERRFCLRDTDGDGLLDASLMLGKGDESFVPGDTVQPVGVAPADGARVTRDTEVRLGITRVSRRKIRFQLSASERGMSVGYANFDAEVPRDDGREDQDGRTYPVEVDVFGMTFEVIGHDRREDTVTIRWPEVSEPVQITVPEQRRWYVGG